MVEYLYIDSGRLDSYVEQISGLVAYDKVPIWKAALSLVGPTIETLQARTQRPLTTHEKIELLRNHLSRNELLFDRHSENFSALGEFDGRVFAEELILADRLILPERWEANAHLPELALWIDSATGYTANGPGDLVLIEQFRSDDRSMWPTGKRTTPLYALFIFASQVPEWGDLLTSQFFSTKRPWTRYIALSPFLRSVGAKVVDTRWIKALYRIRSADHGHIVGYPIVISLP